MTPSLVKVGRATAPVPSLEQTPDRDDEVGRFDTKRRKNPFLF